jgi:hypothetical protein
MSTDLLTRTLDKATKEEAILFRKLEAAIDALHLAEAQFHSTGADPELDAVQRDRLRVERARKIHGDAITARETAQAKVDSADLARAREAHAHDLLSLPHFGESLVSLHDRLIDLDRAAYALVADYDRAVEAGQGEWDRAAATAARVNSHLGSITRPNLDDAILAAQIEATAVRESEDRDQVDDLLREPLAHGDWRAADLSARERANHVKAQKEREAQELRREGAAAVVALAEERMRAATPEPVTDDTAEPNEAAQ